MLRIEKDFDLSALNTFRMTVRCNTFVEFDSAKDFETLDFDSLPRPFMTLGCGSNVLFTKDFPGTVFHSAINYIKYVDVGLDEVPVMVGSGVKLDDFISQACGYCLWGAENLSLIPGTVGAAAVQNVGAYGVEFKDIVSGISCWDIQEHKSTRFKPQECSYGYRDSFFKHAEGRYIITAVLCRLSRKKRPQLDYKGLSEALGGKQPQSPMEVREAVIAIRRKKLPDPEEIGSAGSFFKNPVVDALTFAKVIDIARSLEGPSVVVPHYVLEGGFVKIPAAWLIDHCGFKGAECGGAAVYEKQPLVIVNKSGNASARDILSLESRIVEGVKSHFGIVLSPEVEHI